MNNWFVNNRQVIKNLAVNTGTTDVPVWTPFCTTSEITLETDAEMKDFFVFCDSIRRSILTGFSLTLKAVVEIDMNNEAIKTMLGDLHSLILTGDIAQFNNVGIQFELLEKVEANVLTYKKYKMSSVMKITSIGGPAEDEGKYDLELILNGTGEIVNP